MKSQRLIKTDELKVGGRAYAVRYFETETVRGTLRYSSELALSPGDRIILDGSSLTEVESKVARLVAATIYSRVLAARGVAA